MTAPAAVVLDLDGVILQSESIKTEVFEATFRRYPEHLAAMSAYHAANPSLPRRRKFERLADLLGHGGDADLVDELVASFSRRVLDLMTAAPFVPGAEAFLDRFSRIVPLYLASVTPEPDLREIVARRGIDEKFARVFGDPPTEKAEAVRQVVELHGGAPAAVVLVGDAPADLAVARATGVDFIARDSGLPFPAPAPVLHADMSEVGAVLLARFGVRQ